MSASGTTLTMEATGDVDTAIEAFHVVGLYRLRRKSIVRKYLIGGYILCPFRISYLRSVKVISLRAERDLQMENVKAYATLYSNSESEKRVFKLSLDQMKSVNDSIFNKMLQMQKEL